MSTDGQLAHDVLLGYEPLSRHGACWYYVWQAYAAAGASTSMGSSPTAFDGWNLSWGKHPGDFNPPPGAAVWLGRRYDGNMDGDVFIAGQHDGDHAATDQPVYGQTGVTTIQARMNLCGREYLGWTDHVLDCPIVLGGGTPGPIPGPDIDEVEEMAFIANVSVGSPQGAFLIIPNGAGLPSAVGLGGGAAWTLPSVDIKDFPDAFWASVSLK